MSVNAQVRVKILRSELMAAVEERAAECQKDYEKALKVYNLTKSKYPAVVKTALRDAVKAVETNPEKYLQSRYDIRDEVMRNIPDPPQKPVKPEGYKNLLKLLSMGSTESLTISESTFDEYMRSCRR